MCHARPCNLVESIQLQDQLACPARKLDKHNVSLGGEVLSRDTFDCKALCFRYRIKVV